MIVVDHLSKLEIDEQAVVNELITLDSLAAGLHHLFLQVQEFEAPIRHYEDEQRKRVTFSGSGNVERFGLPTAIEALLPCYFHWFGMTVCNYVRLAGFIDGVARGTIARELSGSKEGNDRIKAHCEQYLDGVSALAPIRFWRNKVYAHFALTDPRKDDSALLLDVSTMWQLNFSGSRFRAAGGLVIMGNNDEVEMPDWSLTESYESLASQFWPSEVCSGWWALSARK